MPKGKDKMPAESSTLPDDLQGLVCNMDVGAPLTQEQMMADRQALLRENKQPTVDAAVTEANPYLFEDAAVNHNKFAIVSILSDMLKQKHTDGHQMMKIRGVFATVEAARTALSMLPTENCDLYIYELYKFCPVPCTPQLLEMDAAERDALMNTCLQQYEECRLASQDEFEQRKQTMLDEIKRHEGIKEKVRAGELDENAIESACVVPEPVNEAAPAAAPADLAYMPSDPQLNEFAFAVTAIVDTDEVTAAGFEIPDAMRGVTVLKVAGAFRLEEEAKAHAELLRKKRAYKHIDLSVIRMYEWLPVPPDVDTLPVVKYRQDKLTEAVGQIKSEVTPSEMLQQMQEMNVEESLDIASTMS